MAFTSTPTNYAKSYSQALAQAYPYVLYFGEVFSTPNNGLYRPSLTNARTVEIPSIDVKGAHDVDRDNLSGAFSRGHNNTWESKTMSMYREWSDLLDPMDIQETNMVATISNITNVFNQFQKFPEMNAYAAQKLFGFSQQFGQADAAVLTKDTILDAWDTYNAYLTEQRIPIQGRVCYITPTQYVALKQAAGVTRFIVVGSSNDGGINREVGNLDGITVKQVPSDMMKTMYDFSEGWAPQAGAAQINMMIVHPLSVIAPIVYDVSMVTPPAANTKGKWLYYESYYYDIFYLSRRLAGIYANVSAVALATLIVSSVAGSATGKSTIAVNPGTPADGTIYVYKAGASAQAVNYGDKLTTGWAELSSGVDLTLTSGQTITVAGINATSKQAVSLGTATIVSHA